MHSLFRAARAARAHLAALALLPCICLYADVAAAQANAAPPSVAGGGIVQMLAGLALVLGLVVGAAWLLRRLSVLPGTGAGLIRVIGAAAVGQRERVVLVEIGDTWLLVGVGQGQVRRLHTMPKAENVTPPAAVAPADQGFSVWLRRMMEKRSNG